MASNGRFCAAISTHAPAGGATWSADRNDLFRSFLLTPLREGRHAPINGARSCIAISTHAPAGGATRPRRRVADDVFISTHAPAGGATPACVTPSASIKFLLTPLREGRHVIVVFPQMPDLISTHAPAGGATIGHGPFFPAGSAFLLTPLREGRQKRRRELALPVSISTHAPAGGATRAALPAARDQRAISTHAPAGGATAIFHKSVMRFCGKLPKDDTVLCLASFGFPRRDPKAVYLA